MKTPVNARKKALDAICKKIAMFAVTELYTDEHDLQVKLGEAIQVIDTVSDACVKNDQAAAEAGHE